MSPHTVMMLAPYFAPYVGGAELYVSRLSRYLLEGGHTDRVVVVTSEGPQGQVGTTRQDGVTVHRLRTSVTLSRTPIGLTWHRRLRQIIAQERPDVINAHAPVPGLADVGALAIGRLPFVLTYHAGPMRKQRLLIDVALRGYERFGLSATASRADEIICTSAYVRDAMLASFPGNPVVVRPGVDLDMFAPAALPGRRRALFVGTLNGFARYKGVDTLIEAAAIARRLGRPIAVDVMGDGDGLPGYRDLAERQGVADDVRFLGRLDGHEVVAAYHAADLLVHPTRYDSCPTVVIEAMACARPVVSCALGGVPEVVQDGETGLLVPPSDPRRLAEAMLEVLDSPARAAQMGHAARALVEQENGWPQQAARTAEVYRRAMVRRRSGRAARPTVAVVAPHYAPQLGGMESYARQVAGSLQQSPDLQPVVITSRPGVGTRHECLDGVHVVRLGTWLRISNTPVSPLWPAQLWWQLRRQRAALVATHAPVPVLADIATFVAGRRPVVATYHAGSMSKGRPRLDWLLKAYESVVLPRVFGRAAALVAVSPQSLAWREGATMVPPGVDTERFRPKAATEGSPGEPHAPTLLYVGRLERSSAWKGYDVLVEAFARVRRQFPGARLRLVGEGDARGDIAELARRYGVAEAVELPGGLIGDDLVAAYQEADLVVLPSLTSAESFGMVLVEAMACGTPVIGSRVGGIPYVIEDGVNGLLVPPGDVEALAQACQRVLGTPSLAADLARQGLHAARTRFAWSDGMSRTLDLFRANLPSPDGART